MHDVPSGPIMVHVESNGARDESSDTTVIVPDAVEHAGRGNVIPVGHASE